MKASINGSIGIYTHTELHDISHHKKGCLSLSMHFSYLYCNVDKIVKYSLLHHDYKICKLKVVKQG